MMYNKIVCDCFFAPQHIGTLDLDKDFSVVFRSNQPNSGAIELSMRCDEEGLIQKICFRTNGNPYLIAGLEWFCRHVDRKFVDTVPPIDYQLLVKELSLPIAQYPLALRIADAFKEILTLMNNKLVCERQH